VKKADNVARMEEQEIKCYSKTYDIIVSFERQIMKIRTEVAQSKVRFLAFVMTVLKIGIIAAALLISLTTTSCRRMTLAMVLVISHW
jgi:hypothetical protein